MGEDGGIWAAAQIPVAAALEGAGAARFRMLRTDPFPRFPPALCMYLTSMVWSLMLWRVTEVDHGLDDLNNLEVDDYSVSGVPNTLPTSTQGGEEGTFTPVNNEEVPVQTAMPPTRDVSSITKPFLDANRSSTPYSFPAAISDASEC